MANTATAFLGATKLGRAARLMGASALGLGLSLAAAQPQAIAQVETAIGGTQLAQNISGTPLYGSFNLRAGFTPDPFTVNVTAGGGTNAATLGIGSGCVGNITTAQPDVRVNYQSGSLPLSFFVRSNADTTLIINGPDGRWYCNDDFDGLNPRVRFNRPASGQYDIWVGTFGSSTAPATLGVTEL